MNINMNHGDTCLLIEAVRERRLLRNPSASVLATACYETARAMNAITENGGEK